MRREFPVGPHDDGRLLEPQGRDPVHHRRDPQADRRSGTLSPRVSLGLSGWPLAQGSYRQAVDPLGSKVYP